MQLKGLGDEKMELKGLCAFERASAESCCFELQMKLLYETYMTQKYESLSFCVTGRPKCDGVSIDDVVDDTEALLHSLSVRLRNGVFQA